MRVARLIVRRETRESEAIRSLSAGSFRREIILLQVIGNDRSRLPTVFHGFAVCCRLKSTPSRGQPRAMLPSHWWSIGIVLASVTSCMFPLWLISPRGRWNKQDSAYEPNLQDKSSRVHVAALGSSYSCTGTALNDGFAGADPWAVFIEKVEKSDPPIRALGILTTAGLIAILKR